MGKKKKSKKKYLKGELISIELFPAKFVEYVNNNHIILDIRVGNNKIERQMYEALMIEGIENPKYFLIGIKQEVGCTTINFCDANEFIEEFEKLFP